MARYSLHLREGSDGTLDPTGNECLGLGALWQRVLATAPDATAGAAHRGIVDFRFRTGAGNEAGQTVYCWPFRRAVSLVPGG
jgi:hypothetical protein